MNCPDDIAHAVLGIIEDALLIMRAAGFEGRAEACAVEADHVHNLPALLRDYRPELVEYYWNVERVSYLSARPVMAGPFARRWAELRVCMLRHGLRTDD